MEGLLKNSRVDDQRKKLNIEDFSDFLRDFKVYFHGLPKNLRKKRSPVTGEDLDKMCTAIERVINMRSSIQKIILQLTLDFPTDHSFQMEKFRAGSRPADLIEIDGGVSDLFESQDLVELVKKFPELSVKDD